MADKTATVRNALMRMVQKDTALTNAFFQLRDKSLGLKLAAGASFQTEAKRLLREAKVLREEVEAHFSSEEEIFFPYVAAHIPRLLGTLHILNVEHDVVRGRISQFIQHLERLIKTNKVRNREDFMERVKAEVVYLSYVMGNHFHTETVSVYHELKSLKRDEKEELLVILTRIEEKI